MESKQLVLSRRCKGSPGVLPVSAGSIGSAVHVRVATMTCIIYNASLARLPFRSRRCPTTQKRWKPSPSATAASQRSSSLFTDSTRHKPMLPCSLSSCKHVFCILTCTQCTAGCNLDHSSTSAVLCACRFVRQFTSACQESPQIFQVRLIP
jgi:hypothetical protein